MKPLKDWDNLKNGYIFKQRTWYSLHHLGLDKICSCGTEILMPFDGRIKKLHGIQGGNTIWVYPFKQNVVIRMLHCKAVKPSGKYKEGEVIGWVGNTGLSRGCHLHLDISKNKIINIWNINNFIDPEKFNWDKTMKITKEELEKLYQLVLHRETDDDADAYIGHELEFVLDEMRKSKEWQIKKSVIEIIKDNFK